MVDACFLDTFDSSRIRRFFVQGYKLLFDIAGIMFGVGFAGAGSKLWTATREAFSRS